MPVQPRDVLAELLPVRPVRHDVAGPLFERYVFRFEGTMFREERTVFVLNRSSSVTAVRYNNRSVSRRALVFVNEPA
jgi:hypothetical protein